MKLFLALITVFIICFTTYSQPTAIKNLVLEGGGIRGIAYVGAIDELQKNHTLDSIKNIAGTSAGSIIAAMLSVGYTSNELITILSSIKFQKFNDNEFGFISGSKRMLDKYGWYKGNKFENFIEKLMAEKTDINAITLKQLHELHVKNPNQFKELYVTATDILTQTAVVISYQNYPEMTVSKAVRCSMSIPFYFKPVPWNFVDKDFSEIHYPQLLVDGGVLLNYPIFIFDNQFQKNQTIGLRLDDSIESYNFTKQVNQNSNLNSSLKIKNLKDFTMDFYYLIMTAINDKNLTALDKERTIQISPGNIGQKIKRLKKSEVELLVENGRKAVLLYLQK
ncbi:MAG: hypothetical protein RIQ33_187 [Bacteroidota bacterium]|jgi:NTE family protein